MKRRKRTRMKIKSSCHDIQNNRHGIRGSNRQETILSKIDPQVTYWYKCYVEFPALQSNDFNTKFRRRFRLPYCAFRALVNDMKDCEIFNQWARTSCVSKKKPRPMELVALGSLRYLDTWVEGGSLMI